MAHYLDGPNSLSSQQYHIFDPFSESQVCACIHCQCTLHVMLQLEARLLQCDATFQYHETWERVPARTLHLIAIVAVATVHERRHGCRHCSIAVVRSFSEEVRVVEEELDGILHESSGFFAARKLNHRLHCITLDSRKRLASVHNTQRTHFGALHRVQPSA
jgi:hypothetical protein